MVQPQMSTRDAYENRTMKTAHPTAEREPL